MIRSMAQDFPTPIGQRIRAPLPCAVIKSRRRGPSQWDAERGERLLAEDRRSSDLDPLQLEHPAISGIAASCSLVTLG